jgi:hypothetical protein
VESGRASPLDHLIFQFRTLLEQAPMNLTDVLQNPPRAQRKPDGEYVSMGLADDVSHFISDHVDDSSFTLETGCGLSTVLFALSGARHICITPATDEIDRIKEYCGRNGIALDKVTFHASSSEKVLPGIECDSLDLVLIDGRHGFPAPFIDFYYTAGKLKIDGLLVIDDTWLWTGDILKQILLLEPEWKLEVDFSPRASAFRKLAEGSQTKEWTEQNFVVSNSILKLNVPPPSYFVTAGRYLKRGEFAVLGRMVARKLGRFVRPNGKIA